MRWVVLAALIAVPAQDAKKTLADAIDKVRGSGSYRSKFKATVKTPSSDPVVLDGESVWVKPGVLYIHYKASGGDEKRIIRVGSDVFLYHEVVEDWVDAAQAGNAGAGRGVQNPDEVLAVLRGHLEGAAFAGATTVQIKMAGSDIEKIMKEQANQGTFDWKLSSAEVKVELSADGKIAKFASAASLASTDPALAGKKVEYSAEVEVLSYDKERDLKFTVTKTKKTTELEVPKEIKEMIEKLGKK
jgi:outer membrane lipoprotein-sorting protein